MFYTLLGRLRRLVGDQYGQDLVESRISFLAVLEEKGSRSTAAMQWFSHYCNVRYSFRCRSDLRICPIVPFRRPQRAFWPQLPRADASVTR